MLANDVIVRGRQKCDKTATAVLCNHSAKPKLLLWKFRRSFVLLRKRFCVFGASSMMRVCAMKYIIRMRMCVKDTNLLPQYDKRFPRLSKGSCWEQKRKQNMKKSK